MARDLFRDYISGDTVTKDYGEVSGSMVLDVDEEERVCAEGCGAMLRKSNLGDFCSVCKKGYDEEEGEIGVRIRVKRKMYILFNVFANMGFLFYDRSKV